MMKNRDSKHLLSALVAVVLFLVVCLPLTSISPFGGSSEAREAHVARVIVEKGEWVLPLRNGLVPSKPPLHHWLSAGVSHLRGMVSEANIRIPSTILGTMILVLVFFRASALSATRYGAVGAVFVLASTYGFLPLLFDGRVDVTCSFFMLAAAFSLLKRLEDKGTDGVRGFDLFLFFLFSAIATLAKGPLGLVLPAVIVFSSFAWFSGLRETAFLFIRPHYSWLLFLIVALPWYILASMKGGEGFVNRQIVFENLKRFVGSEGMNTETWWYYAPSFFRQAFPWSVIFIYLFVSDLRKYLSLKKRVCTGSDRQIRSLKLRLSYAIGFTVSILFFSLASGKRHSYLFPLFPLMSIFLVMSLEERFMRLKESLRAGWLEAAEKASVIVFFTALIFSFFLVCIPFVPFVWQFDKSGGRAELFHFLLDWMQSVSPFMLWVLFGACIVFVAGELSTGKRSRIACGVFVFACLFAVLLEFSLGIKNSMKGFDELAARVNGMRGAKQVYIVRTRAAEYFDPLMYYLGRDAEIVEPSVSGFPCCRQGVFVAKESFFEELSKSPEASAKEVLRFRERDDELLKKRGQETVVFTCG